VIATAASAMMADRKAPNINNDMGHLNVACVRRRHDV
jgi:hypothetical protein